MTLIQTDSKQFGLKDDMRITFTQAATMAGVCLTTVHTAAQEGKLENVTFAGQGGWGADTVYNNETTPRAVKKWRAGVRRRRKMSNFEREVWLDALALAYEKSILVDQ